MDKKSKRQSNISKYANMKSVSTWQITYFNDRIRRIVWQLPAGILADYLRLTDAMALYGADLRMPHSKSMGSGLFELRPKGPEGQRLLHGFFIACKWEKLLWCCTLSSRKPKRLQQKKYD